MERIRRKTPLYTMEEICKMNGVEYDTTHSSNGVKINDDKENNMYAINNKFEIGEQCYSVYRVPVKYECPICKGEGEFEHNGYKIRCHNCDGTGQAHHNKETLLDVCKVQINSIKVSITNDNTITVRYKVSGIGCNARNRAETTLFKSLEKAEEYCKLVNTKQNAPEF